MIKNIIFDLGGVLLDIDPLRTAKAFENLGLPSAIGEGGWTFNHPVFYQMEQGQISDHQFRDGIREILPASRTNEEIDAAWCAMLIDFPEEKVRLLEALKQSFNLYLLSNTNSIHLSSFRNQFEKKFGFLPDRLFCETFYSHEIEKRKPTPESFQHVIEKLGIVPFETLFIDDSLKNLETAKEIGFATCHVRTNDILPSEDWFKQLTSSPSTATQ